MSKKSQHVEAVLATTLKPGDFFVREGKDGKPEASKVWHITRTDNGMVIATFHFITNCHYDDLVEVMRA